MDKFLTVFVTAMIVIALLIGVTGVIVTLKEFLRSEKARRIAKKSGNGKEANDLNKKTTGLALFFVIFMTMPLLIAMVMIICLRLIEFMLK